MRLLNSLGLIAPPTSFEAAAIYRKGGEKGKMEAEMKEAKIPAEDSKVVCSRCGKAKKDLFVVTTMNKKRDRIIGFLFACRACWPKVDGKDLILRDPE